MRVRRAGPLAIAVVGIASRAVAQATPAAEPVPAVQPALAPPAPAPAPPPAPRGAPEPVRVTYEAPPSCPPEDAFLALVRARVGTGWEAPPGALARTLTVRVLSNEASSVARIEYTDDAGNPVSRTVGANTCGEVVSGIALVTALAIESRLGPPPSEPPPPPVAPPVIPPAPPPAAKPAPNRQTQIPHVDLGAGALALSGVGPSFAFGAHGFIGLGWEHGPDFRVGFGAPQTAWEDAPNTNSQSQFALYAVRVSGCPFAFESRSVRALPCLGLETGAHHAESLGSAVGSAGPAGSFQPGSASPPSVAPFLSLRGEASFEAVFAELEAEARFPLGNHAFHIPEPDQTVLVYTVPPVAFGAFFAVGVRL